MSTQIKLGLYVVTLVGTLLFGNLFLRAWRKSDAGAPIPAAAASSQSKRAVGATNRPPPAAAARSGFKTNAPPGTNAATATKATTAADGGTNAPVDSKEAGADAAAAESEPTPEREPVPDTHGLSNRTSGMSDLILWGLLGVASVLGLGGLIAYDTAQYLGRQAADSLFDHDGEDLPESAYEKVENAYGKGEFLEAINLLRSFLAENPKAVHAKIRIAEIYEKDLHNPVAAALEYEEVMKYRMDPERRGWAGIHLFNLYTHLDKPDLALAWLQRVVVECPNTPAAAKARDRLEATGIELPPTPPPGAGGEAGADGGGASGLPPGFRPKS